MQISQELKDLICSRFLEGEFLSALSVKYKIPKVWLVSFLQEKGINPSRLGKITDEKRNQIIELYNSGLSSHVVSKQLGVSTDTVLSSVKKNGNNIRSNTDYRTSTLNENYFETIDTANKAYYLGFIAADGCNRESRFLEIFISKEDISILESFLLDLESNYQIHIRKEKYAQLTIFSRKLMSDLERHGITQRKSLTLEFPKTVPNEFISDFIRGYFDGDGWISKDGKGIEIVGTLDMVFNISEYIYNSIKLNPSKIQSKENIFSVFYHGAKRTAQLYEYLYKQNSICLERKLLRFKQNKYTSNT